MTAKAMAALAALLLCGGRGQAQAQAQAAEAEATPPEADVALRSVETRMGTDVRINGAGPFRFIVDTGSTRTVVSRTLAEALRLPPAGAAMVHSVGGSAPVATARIDALDLGGLAAAPIVAPVLEQRDLGAVGILGIDALAGKAVLMDLAANRMTVRPASRPIPVPADEAEIVVVARRRFGQLILVRCDIDGEKIDVVLDTGSQVSIGNLALRDRLARRRPAARPGSVELHDVAGNVLPAEMRQLPTIRLGGIRVIGAPAAFVDAHPFRQFDMLDRPAMLLGMDILRQFPRILIDFGAKKVRFILDRQRAFAIRTHG